MKDKEKRLLLKIDNLAASYYKKEILQGVSMEVRAGEIVALVGMNGSGKSTLLKAIAGLITTKTGTIKFRGVDIVDKEPHELVRNGLGYMMQVSTVFPNLTVLEHLQLATHSIERSRIAERLDEVWQVFPVLKPLYKRRGGLLSGGERQMLGFSMLLAQDTSFWLLDEPSSGLHPEAVRRLMEVLKRLSMSHGITVLLVEQNLREGLKISDRAYVLKNATTLTERKPLEILGHDRLEHVFF